MCENLTIAPADSDQWLASLGVVFQGFPAKESARRIAEAVVSTRTNPAALDHLLVARRGNDPVGAVWGQVSPGRTALLWGPELIGSEAHTTALQLLQDLFASLAPADVRLVQALPNSESLDRVLSESGLSTTVELLYLSVEASESAKPESELHFVPFEDNLESKLAEVIEATYAGTRDAPVLNGVRDIEDVIEGYRQNGHYSPGRWWLVNEDQGCLLLTDHPRRNQLELVYMGIVPAARGQGWGEQMVRFAKWQTALASRSHLVLAVDASNDPAIRIYTRQKFEPFHRQTVRLKFL